ncbi:MAG: hypothetical protein H6Q79_2319 [Deltaproteobacteria bacterium]|nr:hypothetical protein [Deltaproteobacteria bacterium]
MEITLTGTEKDVLRETVEKAIHEMLMEIANTDNRKMREGLREREGSRRGMSEPPIVTGGSDRKGREPVQAVLWGRRTGHSRPVHFRNHRRNHCEVSIPSCRNII